MKRTKFYTNEALKNSFISALETSAKRIDELGAVVRAETPRAKWGTEYVWTLTQNEAARQHLAGVLLRNEAARLNLFYPDRKDDAPITAEQRFDMRLAERKAADKIDFAYYFNGAILSDLLRMGALSVDGNGAAKIADDAAARIDDFCTIYFESEKEAEFVQRFNELKDAAASLEKAFKAVHELAANPDGKYNISLGAWDYDVNSFVLGNPRGDHVKLLAEGAAVDAFLLFQMPRTSGRADTPHYYNKVSCVKLSGANLSTIFGIEIKPFAIDGRKFV